MKTVLERMTPERARDLLEKNTRNRPLRKSVVERISRDILAGRWHVHHQGIGIAPTFIVDGQHRLHAVVQTGIPVDVNVTMYETDEEGEAGLLVVDKNATRTDADVQTIAGVMPKEYARQLVAVIKVLCRAGFATVQKTSLSTDEISSIYGAEKEHLDWAVTEVRDPDGPKRFAALHHAAFAIGHMIDPIRVSKLVKEIIASDSSSGEVALAWQKAASQGKLLSIGSHRGGTDGFYLALRLIQAELQGETITGKSKIRGTATTAEWFRDRIKRKRELEGKEGESASKSADQAA